MEVSHFAGRRVFSFPKNSVQAFQQRCYLPPRKNRQNQATVLGSIWLWCCCPSIERFYFMTQNPQKYKSFKTHSVVNGLLIGHFDIWKLENIVYMFLGLFVLWPNRSSDRISRFENLIFLNFAKFPKILPFTSLWDVSLTSGSSS